jgi:trehalose 6-phosphate phosphatase
MAQETAAGAPPEPQPQDALFIDIDGTLLEIVAQPELVSVPPLLPELLGRLETSRDGALALVSGRPLAEIDRLFQPWHGAAAGLHGAERRRADGSRAGSSDNPAEQVAMMAIDRLRPALRDAIRRLPGVRLEDKGRTLAVHYRAAPGAESEVRRTVAQLTRDDSGVLRTIAGKMVVEVQPRHHGKDRAIAAFLAEPPFRGRRPVFLGDDTTDEDGFAEVNRRAGVSIRVGASRPTAARYALPSVGAALAWLATAAPG